MRLLVLVVIATACVIDYAGGQVRGPPGQKGDRGPPGNSGQRGYAGPSGRTGRTGPSGTPGPQGSRGSSGYQGQNGRSGTSGRPGNTGPPGRDGGKGVKGGKGDSGRNGNTGYAGRSGSPGRPGPTGYGRPGPPGTSGYRGERGPTGPTGSPGSQGPPGPPGTCESGPAPQRVPDCCYFGRHEPRPAQENRGPASRPAEGNRGPARSEIFPSVSPMEDNGSGEEEGMEGHESGEMNGNGARGPENTYKDVKPGGEHMGGMPEGEHADDYTFQCPPRPFMPGDPPPAGERGDNDMERPEHGPPVVFQAFYTGSSLEALPANFPIPFGPADLNMGDAYDNNFGVFTAPKPGHYHVSIAVTASASCAPDQTLVVKVVSRGVISVMVSSRPGQTASASLLVPMDVNDELSIQIDGSSTCFQMTEGRQNYITAMFAIKPRP